MTFLLLLVLTAGCTPNYDNLEYFDGYPHLTNESLGMVNYFVNASMGPQDYFNLQAWGDAVIGIPGEMAGGVNWLRYELSFSAFAMAMAAENTPAFRKPFVDALDGMIQKMLYHPVWDYWLDPEISWGGDNPIHPYNIMYTGHLQMMMALHERSAGDQKYFSDVDLITSDGTQTWSTNLETLSADIHNLILTNQDSDGSNYYMVPCETPAVFAVCNSVPHLAFELLPSSIGLDPDAVHEPWRDWLEENMFDSDTNYFYLVYAPFEEPPHMNTSLTGAYNAWTWNYIYGFYPEWVEAAYPIFKSYAFEEDLVGEGTAVLLYGAPGSGLGEGLLVALDIGGTGMGMVLAKQMEDEEGYNALHGGYNALAGNPSWAAGGVYGYYGFPWGIMFGAIPTLWELWANATNSEINIRSIVESPRGPDFYAQPVLAEVSNPGTFVNQAIWDDPALYITINGAHITKEPTDLIIQNLKAGSTYQVVLNDEDYTGWTRSPSGEEITITTPALSGKSTQMYQIIEDPPAP